MTDLAGTLRADGDLGAVRFEREYATTPDDVWSAVTEPDRVARWLARVSGDLRPGGRFQVQFDDGDSHFQIASCDPPRSLVVQWHHRDRSSQVSVAVGAIDAERTRLVLEHSELTVDQAPDYAAGWHLHLASLGEVLRGEQITGQEVSDWGDEFPPLKESYVQKLRSTP